MSAPMLVMIVDLALAIIVVEVAVLLFASWRKPAGAEASRKTLLLTMLSGLGLLLALRAVAAGADPLLALAGLTLGGLAHVADIGRACVGTARPSGSHQIVRS